MYIPKYHGDNKKEGILKLEQQKERDKIKNEFCEKTSIKLIRISYRQNKQIKEILKENLFLNATF